MKRWGFHVLCVVLAACSSQSSRTGGSGSADTLACRQKADADTGNDCAAHKGIPRKLDCDSDSAQQEALDAGCVAEKPGKSDVCCPTSVSGTPESSGGGKETTIACTEPSDTLTDSSCAGTSHPRKLDCESAAAQQAGVDVGCRAEHADVASDYDLCCPLSVRGGG